MAIANTARHALEDHNVEYQLVTHPRTFSTRATAEAAHVPDDHIAKAVIVKDGAGYAMVVTPGDHWLKLDALNEETGRRFDLAPEDEMDTLFMDCRAGAIPPLGPSYGLETFVDEALISLANVYFEAGDHDHLVHVSGEDFARLLQGARHGLFSHD
jgi:Ala-tRNA(Pro) deacylase